MAYMEAFHEDRSQEQLQDQGQQRQIRPSITTIVTDLIQKHAARTAPGEHAYR